MNRLTTLLAILGVMGFSIGFVLGIKFVNAYEADIDYKVDIYDRGDGKVRIYAKDTVIIAPFDSLEEVIIKDNE